MGVKSLLSCCGSQRTADGREPSSDDENKPIERHSDSKVKRKLSWKKLRFEKDKNEELPAASDEDESRRKHTWSSFTSWMAGVFRPSRSATYAVKSADPRHPQVDITSSPDGGDNLITADDVHADGIEAVTRLATSIVKDAIHKALAKLIVQHVISEAITVCAKDNMADVEDGVDDVEHVTISVDDVHAAGDATTVLQTEKTNEPPSPNTCVDSGVFKE